MAREIISGIYQIKNKVNNKIYIGSSKDIYKRWRYHIANFKGNRHCNKYFQASWNKYGEDNFEFSILEKVTNLEDLKDIEQRYLLKLNPFKENGYNLCRTTESYSFGYKLSDDTINKIKERKFTEEHILNMRLNNSRRKPVFQYDLYGTFIKRWECVSDISRFKPEYKVDSIAQCCNSNSSHISCYGYLWFYVEDFSDDRLQYYVKNQHFSNKKAIVQLSLTGEYIQTWLSVVEAAKSVKISHCNISKCCKGINKKAAGFRWIYLDDYKIHNNNILIFLKDLFKPTARPSKKVVQLDMNYNLIEIWDNASTIENKLKIKYCNITGCCNGKSKSSNGFRWMYESEYKLGKYESLI